MTATQRFIEDAIKGGWPKAYANGGQKTTGKLDASDLLDPFAWQAVGKPRDWCSGQFAQPNGTCVDCGEDGARCEGWRLNLHNFIEHLADGKTIEEALAALEK